MNIYVESEICKKCSFFKEYDSLIEVLDFSFAANDSNDSNTFIGKCMKCNNNISLKYLKNKKSCPFAKLTDGEVRLVRIWSAVWNSRS